MADLCGCEVSVDSIENSDLNVSDVSGTESCVTNDELRFVELPQESQTQIVDRDSGVEVSDIRHVSTSRHHDTLSLEFATQ